jgi:hypothetical protein
MRRWLVMCSLGLVLGLAQAVSACPNCKEAVAAQDTVGAQDSNQTALMKYGWNSSVLVMMAMPFTLLGTGAFFVVRAAKRGSLPEL